MICTNLIVIFFLLFVDLKRFVLLTAVFHKQNNKENVNENCSVHVVSNLIDK